MKQESGVRSQDREGHRAPGGETVRTPASEPTTPPSARLLGKEGNGSAPRLLIPEEWRNDVEELLVAGAAVEEIVEAVMAKGGPEIPAGAVLGHYRIRPDLQRRRVEQTVKGAAELREALGNPQADHALVQLANAALIVGYQGLTKKSASLTIKDAETIRLARQNLKLRQRILRIKALNERRAHALHWKRLRYEDVKYATAVARLKQLRRELHGLMEEGKLEPQTLEKIREIYGIIRQPYIPPESADAPAADGQA
jgi:hypothetical protein